MPAKQRLLRRERRSVRPSSVVRATMSAVTVANLRPSRSARIDSRQPTRPASSGCNARISVSANANRSPSGSSARPSSRSARTLSVVASSRATARSMPPSRAPFPAASPRGRSHPSPPIARDLRSRGGQASARTRRAVVHAGHRDRVSASSDVRWPAAAPGRSRTSRSFPFEQLHGSLDRERSGRAERVCAVEEQAPCERLKVRLRGSRHRGPM